LNFTLTLTVGYDSSRDPDSPVTPLWCPCEDVGATLPFHGVPLDRIICVRVVLILPLDEVHVTSFLVMSQSTEVLHLEVQTLASALARNSMRVWDPAIASS